MRSDRQQKRRGGRQSARSGCGVLLSTLSPNGRDPAAPAAAAAVTMMAAAARCACVLVSCHAFMLAIVQ